MTINPKSDLNRDIRSLYALVFWLAFGVFVVVEAILLYSVIRFRRRPGDPLPAQTHGNNRLEIAWTIAPVLLLIVVAIPTVRTMLKMYDAPPADSTQVKIIGHQFWWEVQYPDLGVITANEIHIPVSKTAAFTLTSADVQHSFWVPKMGGKADLFPNRTNYLHFKPDEPGTYYGQCAELCGLSHGFMKMRLIVQSDSDFNAWVAAQKQAATPAQDDLAKKGQQIFMTNACIGCHFIEGTNAKARVGPDLSHVGSRTTIASGWLENTPDNMKRWIHNPSAIKEGALMPAFGQLSPEDLDALAAYLESLK